MTNVSPISTAPLGRIAPVSTNAVEPREAPARPGADRPADRVEVSDMARLMARLNQLPDVRADLVEKARADIAAGRYDDDERLELAIDALIDDLDTL